MRILVMGYKHAGKTSMGKRLAEALGLPFVDMDEATEAAYGGGKTFREIYQSEGKRFFRSLEKKVIHQLLKSGPVVLAGAPVHSLPAQLLRQFEHRIFLRPSRKTLLQRIEASGRPAFFDTDLSLEKAFEKSYASRLSAYEQAQTFCVRDENLDRAVQVTAAQIQRPKLTVPIREEGSAAVIDRLASLDSSVDYAELWLDWVKKPDLPAIFAAARHPLLIVVKGEVEQGRFKGSPEEKLALLEACIHLGARFVDVDRHFPLVPELVKLTKKSFCQLILSFHDFDSCPPLEQMQGIVRAQRKLKADICKVAVTAECRDKCLDLIELLLWARKRGIPMIGTAMGEAGRLSRLLGPVMGTLGFACRDASEASAPGQMTVGSLRQLLRELGA